MNYIQAVISCDNSSARQLHFLRGFDSNTLLIKHMTVTAVTGVCNTACFLASRAGRTEVTQADLVAAVEQTKYGKTYEASKFVSPGRKRRFAVIEAGFCVAIALLPAIEEIDYVTILPSIKSPVGRTVLKVRWGDIWLAISSGCSSVDPWLTMAGLLVRGIACKRQQAASCLAFTSSRYTGPHSPALICCACHHKQLATIRPAS